MFLAALGEEKRESLFALDSPVTLSHPFGVPASRVAHRCADDRFNLRFFNLVVPRRVELPLLENENLSSLIDRQKDRKLSYCLSIRYLRFCGFSISSKAGAKLLLFLQTAKFSLTKMRGLSLIFCIFRTVKTALTIQFVR